MTSSADQPTSSSSDKTIHPGQSLELAGKQIVVRVESVASSKSWKGFGRIVQIALFGSVCLNLWYILIQPTLYQPPLIPEVHLYGTDGAADRIAVINFAGTISPPFTERWIRQIQRAAEDETVRGVILAIDSPGGFVADSHEIYRELQKLAEKKPVYAAMKRIAASGGLYIAMGIGTNGLIYAEPTTWTGSIGVIVPRYNAAELAAKVGVKVEPLVTGPLKDSLNPFRDLTPAEQVVWAAILDDSFTRFVGVIADNRIQLDHDAVRALATGQIYTANQALQNHLVDQIGYVEDAVTALAKQLQLSSYDAFEYRSLPGLIDSLLGADVTETPSITEQLLDSTVPKAMYYCSWNPWVGSGSQ